MLKVALEDIHNFACRGTNLEIIPGELLVLLGPNGAGKTTLLNVIAGLVPYKGTVRFDDVAVDLLPARERHVGYVFQDLVLFPHLTVAANIAYGLHNVDITADERNDRVLALLNLLAIEHLRNRYPKKLSGGEKQRVALARALAPRPKLLLLDEPFSRLDAQTSSFLRAELKQLQRELAMTTLFVTHDLVEAEQIADRIVIIKNGIVEQIGTPTDVLFYPSSEPVRNYLGSPNVLECEAVRPLGHGVSEAQCGRLRIVVPASQETIGRILILPRDIKIYAERPCAEMNIFAGTIRQATPKKNTILVQVDVQGRIISVECPAITSVSPRFQVGQDVFVALDFTRLKIAPSK